VFDFFSLKKIYQVLHALPIITSTFDPEEEVEPDKFSTDNQAIRIVINLKAAPNAFWK
jgi:hypothetical protein